MSKCEVEALMSRAQVWGRRDMKGGWYEFRWSASLREKKSEEATTNAPSLYLHAAAFVSNLVAIVRLARSFRIKTLRRQVFKAL